MAKTLDFYRKLGLDVDAAPTAEHVAINFPNGFLLELDVVDFVPMWDTGWRGETGGGAVIGMQLPTRESVDERYQALTEAGYQGRQPPYDAFWGARYAIVADPDGYPVGLMSPITAERKFWPPSQPPRG
jgi:uncharacterized glyoxalase superfamily protein PhnB